MLKKTVAIFILSIYVISITELAQLAKLPILIEHFAEHKQKNKDLSLLDFLYMHYSQSANKDADYDKDMKLPFKSHDGCISVIAFGFIPTTFNCETVKPVFSIEKSYSTYTEEFLTSSYLASIWQPPKSC